MVVRTEERLLSFSDVGTRDAAKKLATAKTTPQQRIIRPHISIVSRLRLGTPDLLKRLLS